jgi:hypothetical protein
LGDTHNLGVWNNRFTYKGQAMNTILDIKLK